MAQKEPEKNLENNRQQHTQPARDRYRDNDDVRQPLEGDARTGANADTKFEARGTARENVGNTARGTDAAPSGAEENDNNANRPRDDDFDKDLERSNHR